MHSVLAAEAAVLVHFQSVRIVLLVLHGVVVALLALRAGEGDLDSHNGTSNNSQTGFLSLPQGFYSTEKTAQKNKPLLRYIYYTTVLWQGQPFF